MTQKSVGSGTPAGEWELTGAGFDENGSTGTVVFDSTSRPGIVLILTLDLDGTETIRRIDISRPGRQSSVEAAISTRLLRSIPLGQLAHAGLQELRRRAVPQPWQDDPADQEEAILLSLALSSVPLDHKRPGRRGHPLKYYAELAVQYEQWQQSGDRLAALAERRHLSESALRAALGTARRKGLLTPALRGRAGGKATELAKTILRAAAEQGADATRILPASSFGPPTVARQDHPFRGCPER